jgi:hypothetical protein
VGGRDRVAEVSARLGTGLERARGLTDLVVTSVLLDAGAGSAWRYVESDSGFEARRSEGLALASLSAFVGGSFSSDPSRPLQADATALTALSSERLASAFQVREDNLLLGLEGRQQLLARLGRQVLAQPDLFGGLSRVGGLCDVLVSRAEGGRIAATQVLSLVLEALGPIWPSRTRLLGRELGDVWPHPAAGGEGPSAGLVPLHKLSQWLSYSLIHPLTEAGLTVTDLDALTGLAEYRNGGLFVDTGVLVPRHEAVTAEVHAAGSVIVVEWRALTVALLDRLAREVRRLSGLDAEALPLGSVLEGGSWAAGRRLAERRPGGAPPIRVSSDGTLF